MRPRTAHPNSRAAIETVPQSIMSIATRTASASVFSSEPVTHSRVNSWPLSANGAPSRRLILARHFPRPISNALMTNCRYSITHPPNPGTLCQYTTGTIAWHNYDAAVASNRHRGSHCTRGRGRGRDQFGRDNATLLTHSLQQAPYRRLGLGPAFRQVAAIVGVMVCVMTKGKLS